MTRLALVAGMVAGASSVALPAQAFNGSVSVVGSQGRGGDAYERGVTVKIAHQASLGGGVQLRAEGRYRYNAAACDDRWSDATCDAYRSDADWRELYLSRDVGSWQLSAGLQQVVWGRADNLRVFDLVNPLDLRDFVLPDLGEYRIATPMVRALGTAGGWTVEALWQPYFTPHDYAASGSAYDLGLDARFAATGLATRDARRPRRDGSAGEAGLQLSTTRGSLDISLLGYTGYNDDPVYALELDDPAQPAVRGQFRRHATVGAGLAYAFDGGWVARGEATWSPDAPVSDLGGTAPRRAATANLLVGLDYQWRDWVLSAQASDRHIASWDAAMATTERAAVLSVSATGSSHAGRMSHRLAYTVMPQAGDGAWLQWRSAYQFDDHWQVEANLDLLDGADTGFFGQFRERDRLRLELRRQF